MTNCQCHIVDRQEHTTQREWLKESFCMYHWMQTDYYRAKLHNFIDGICSRCGQEEAIANNICGFD